MKRHLFLSFAAGAVAGLSCGGGDRIEFRPAANVAMGAGTNVEGGIGEAEPGQCDSDDDCANHGLVCDLTARRCVECQRHSDCADTYHCVLGECAPNVICETGQTGCAGGAIVACNADGSAFTNPQPCKQGVCVEHGDTAACELPDAGTEGDSGADGATCATLYFRDSDGDTFGDPGYSVTACTAPEGYVDNDEDCYDDNANAKPGQSEYFVEDRGDGSFDYDCAEGESQQFATVGACGGFPTCGLTEGWDGSAPACGTSGEWFTGCVGLVSVCQKSTESRPQGCR